MSKLFPHSLIGIVSVLPALLVMPAVADPANTAGTAFLFGDVSISGQNTIDNTAFGGRRMEWSYVKQDAETGVWNIVDQGTEGSVYKYRNEFPTYKMVGRSFELSDSVAYVGPVTLTLRELTQSDHLAYNWADEGVDIDLAEAAGVDFGNDATTIYGAVANVINPEGYKPGQEHYVYGGAGDNAYYTAPGVIAFANRDNSKAAGSMTFSNVNAVIDGATVNADAISITNGSSLNFVKQDHSSMDSAERFYSNAADISSTGKTTLNADTIDVVDSSLVVNSGAAAIFNATTMATLNNVTVTNGQGQIKNTGNMTVNGTSTFSGNSFSGDGGAIYNDGELTINGVENVITFKNNTAGGYGGAIRSTLDGLVNVYHTQFAGNTVNGTSGYQLGGAMFVSGEAVIEDSLFDGNKALGNNGFGGAIYAGTSSDIEITRSIFTNNEAASGGALDLFRSVKMTDVTVKDNKALDANEDGAGGLFLGAVSTSTFNSVSGSHFIHNTSAAAAGGMGTRAFKDGNNVSASLDVSGTEFTNNVATTTGGAIDNYFYNDAAGDGYVKVTSATFTSNSAANGGAVYNHIGHIGDNLRTTGRQTAESAESDIQVGSMYFTGTTFTGNTATAAGGAIYNEGTLTFAGENTFSGNTANGVANDIYNAGTLTFAADSATEMDGGINGSGALTIVSGAVLDLGTASIQQGTLTLDGTINATLLNATKFASFDVADFGASAGDLNLTLKSVGTYNVFKNAVFNTGSVNIADSSVFTYNWNDAGDTITVTTKSVDEIVAATDVKAEAANAVVTLTNAKDETAKQIGEILSTALADGNNEYVEQETKKLAPEDKPVAHSVASNVQNQVLTLTANRMSGGIAAGRAGGDEINADYGVWMQGLLNKSRYAGQFDGNSRGFAIGADALINKVFTVGLGYAFSNADVSMSHDGGDMDIDSHTVFVYGQYKPNQWFINATLSNTISKYNEKVKVAGLPVETDYDVNAFGIQALTGYDFKSGLTPMVGTRYLHVSTDGHDRLIGHVSDASSSFLSMVGGAKYAFDIHTAGEVSFMPELHAMLTYDVISDKNEATVYVPGGSVYHVAGDRLSRVGGEFGLGLTTEWRGLELSVNYDLALHKDYTSHTGMLKLRYEF